MNDRAERVRLLARGLRAASRARVERGERAVIVGSGALAELVGVAFSGAGAVVTMLPRVEDVPALAAATVAVDTTGDPEVILGLLERVAQMGRVVLLETTRGRTVDVDFYRAVHLRGLQVVGVAEPEAEDVAAAEELVAHARA
jgi:threonine dehydrogenase-like Zn-dependent dehydrogenase